MLKSLLECPSQLTDFHREHHTSGDLGPTAHSGIRNVFWLPSTDP